MISSVIDGGCVIAASELKMIEIWTIPSVLHEKKISECYLISDIEFLISFRSRFNAIAFISEDDCIEDVEDDMWCSFCDDEAFATRDVVVLDFVEDDVLLLRTYLNKRTFITS